MNRHILVVDDEPAIRYPIVFVFSRLGYEITEAKNGLEALHLILGAESRGRFFDLLLTDLQMPRMSGLELIQELKWNEIPLATIVISGTKDEEMMNRLLNNGCSSSLLKPFDLQQLVEVVETVLENSEKERRKLLQSQFAV
jgi:two-component system response regulator YesN